MKIKNIKLVLSVIEGLKINWEKLFIFFIFIIAFFYRFYGLKLNTPFWVDEFYTASQARLVQLFGLSVFTQPRVYFEYHNITAHFLVAAFFNVFGRQEWVARLPFVMIGSMVPIAVFFLSKRLFNLTAAIGASLLTAFSYFEITWSRQARGYVLQQLLVLLTFYFYFFLLSKKKPSAFNLLFFYFILFLGLLTHSAFIILILSLGAHYLWINKGGLKTWIRKPVFLITSSVLLLALYFIGALNTGLDFLKNNAFGANNLWYYHSFLWREYGLITFLALCGLTISWLKNRKMASAILIYMIFFLIFLSFIFKPYVSRYLAPVFPFLFIYASYTIFQLGMLTKVKNVFPIFLVLFIIANGHKFVNKPKKFYSINHDFREAALIDYSQIYSKIKETNQNLNSKSAVIDTLPDRAQWYLGYDYKLLYLLRGGNLTGFTHGIARKTDFDINEKGEKIIGPDRGLILIADLSDLKRIMEEFPIGFIFIDDSALPGEIIDYAKKNLKKEIYLDHYTLDDNPYSIWPATLYSWGVRPVTNNSGNEVK